MGTSKSLKETTKHRSYFIILHLRLQLAPSLKGKPTLIVVDQDSQTGVTANRRGGVSTYFLAILPKKCMKLKIKNREGGARP